MTTSNTTKTPLSTSVESKKILLLSRLDGSILVQLIDVIRQTGYKIMLIATALGYNYSLNEKNYDSLEKRIGTVYRSVTDPPPILTITGISQLVPILQAIDPDLVISFYFPYQLTEPFLAHRSIKLNVHPSPLPLYRGPNGFIQAVLHQLKAWGTTWHYISKDYDTGNILVQDCFELHPPYGIQELIMRSVDSMFKTLGLAVRMAFEGHPGTPQRQPTPAEESLIDPKPLTIADRTIQSDFNCDQVRNLVEACRYFAPALLRVDERLYHVIEMRCLNPPLLPNLTVGDVKRVLTRFVQQCSDGQIEYVVRIV